MLTAGKVPEALLQDAALKLAQKDYAGARASADEALRQNPEDVRALNLLVQTYSAQNQLPAGLEKAREHALRQPASASIQMFLGQLLSTNGDSLGARKAFEAAIAAQPRLVTAGIALAEIDTREGKRDQARQRLSALISSDPASVPGRLLFAQLEVSEGKTAAGIEQYRKAVALDDKNIFALNGLAYLLAKSKQPDEAIKYAQKAKELAPDNGAVDDTLGWTFSEGLVHIGGDTFGKRHRQGGHSAPEISSGDGLPQSRRPETWAPDVGRGAEDGPKLPEAQAARRAFGIAPN